MELEKSLVDTQELRLVQFIHIYREARVTKLITYRKFKNLF